MFTTEQLQYQSQGTSAISYFMLDKNKALTAHFSKSGKAVQQVEECQVTIIRSRKRDDLCFPYDRPAGRLMAHKKKKREKKHRRRRRKT